MDCEARVGILRYMTEQRYRDRQTDRTEAHTYTDSISSAVASAARSVSPVALHIVADSTTSLSKLGILSWPVWSTVSGG